jgi:hypothetical protein
VYINRLIQDITEKDVEISLLRSSLQSQQHSYHVLQESYQSLQSLLQKAEQRAASVEHSNVQLRNTMQVGPTIYSLLCPAS